MKKPIVIFVIIISVLFVIETIYLFGWRKIEQRISERACERTKVLIIEMIARNNPNYDEIKTNLHKGLENICF